MKLIEIPSLSSQEGDAADFLIKTLPSIIEGKIERNGHSVLIHVGHPETSHRLLLCSHIDTVEPTQGWTKNPYKATVVDGKIYGLGANDALASVVSMIFAASRACRDLPEDIGLTIALVAEEEKGDQGFCRIEPTLSYSDAIFGEPTDLKIGTSMRGYMRLKLFAQGHACHASRPWEGKNAITQLAKMINSISNIDLSDQSEWGRATIEPTVVSGGYSVNQISDYAESILDVRSTQTFNNKKIIDLLNGLKCTFEILHNRRHPMECNMDSRIYKAIKKSHLSLQTYGFGGTCDMAFATKPSVVAGPGKSNRSHAADEYIEEYELKDGINFYEGAIRSYADINA